MDDLEICKRIAKITGELPYIVEGLRLANKNKVHVVADGTILHVYNPLTDDGLCFRLMIKYEVRPAFTECPAGTGKAYYADFNDGSGVTDYCETPNMAVCLAIIELCKESK